MKKLLLISSMLLINYSIPMLSMDLAEKQQYDIKDTNLRQVRHRITSTIPNLIDSIQNALHGKKGRAAQMAAQIALQNAKKALQTKTLGVAPWTIDNVIKNMEDALQMAIDAANDVQIIAQQFDAGQEQDPTMPTASQARNHRNMVEMVTREANTIIQETQEYLEKEEFSEDPVEREREIKTAHNALRSAHEALEMTHIPINMQNAQEIINRLSIAIHTAKRDKDEIRQPNECKPLFEMPKDDIQH